MKTYTTPQNELRLWISDDEIEALIESELRKADLYPSLEAPVTALETFVETYLKVRMDQYHELPVDVLGQTEFSFDPDQAPIILLNRDLTDERDSEHSPQWILARWRATIAHEASHVIFHRSLFLQDRDQAPLFAPDPSHLQQRSLLRCLKRNVEVHRPKLKNKGADWREVQANKGMAAFLMPRTFFLEVVQHEIDRRGRNSPGLLGHLVSHVRGLFAVSRQAAVIRLETLCPALLQGQGIPL